jgi:hypothetical protein
MNPPDDYEDHHDRERRMYPFPHSRFNSSQLDKLFELMRAEIAEKPSGLRHGFWTVAFPSNADIRSPYDVRQCQYIGRIELGGIVVIRTLDGVEVTRGAFGWLWDTPAFSEYRARLELVGGENSVR